MSDTLRVSSRLRTNDRACNKELPSASSHEAEALEASEAAPNTLNRKHTDRMAE